MRSSMPKGADPRPVPQASALLLLALVSGCGTETESTDTGEGGRPPRDTTTVEGEGLPCDILTTLKLNCWACHGLVPNSGAPFSLVSRDDLLTVSSDGGTRGERAIIRMRASEKQMPPNGPRVQEGEIQALEDWLGADAPAGVCEDTGGPCQTCAEFAGKIAQCVPQTGMANVCNEELAPSLYICISQNCGGRCVVTPPGEEPLPCDPANEEDCQACIAESCATAQEQCDQ
jgi:hypothetical protein